MKERVEIELARIKLEMKDWKVVPFYHLRATWKRLFAEHRILQKLLDEENTATEKK